MKFIPDRMPFVEQKILYTSIKKFKDFKDILHVFFQNSRISRTLEHIKTVFKDRFQGQDIFSKIQGFQGHFKDNFHFQGQFKEFKD